MKCVKDSSQEFSLVMIGEIINGGIAEQTQQVLTNLDAVLQASGSSGEQVIKTTVFLKDMNDFVAMNEVHGKVKATFFNKLYVDMTRFYFFFSISPSISLLVALSKLLAFPRM